MKRCNFYFPEDLIKKLRNLSLKTGVPVSEILRRMIRRYFKKDIKNDKHINI